MPPMTVVTSNTSSGLAAAIVVLINWLLAHLATNWVMPTEVSTGVQFIITWIAGEVIVRRKNAAMADNAAKIQAVLAAPDPRDAAPAVPAAA